MEIGKIEDTNRTKINFKIPMKSNKSSDNAGLQAMETFSSPLISDLQQEKISEDRSCLNGVPKRQRLPESINKENPLKRKLNSGSLESINKESPFKRKLNSGMALYAGRNALYPEELNNLILPLFCNLCNAALNSAKSAHFHYLSKSHEKKINNWLAEWSKRTGEPAPKIEKDGGTLSKDSEILFCQYCNVKLTSMQDAKQHYSGKKHASKINAGINPLSKNLEGNSPKNVNTKVVDKRFGIGESFVDFKAIEDVKEKDKDTEKEVGQKVGEQSNEKQDASDIEKNDIESNGSKKEYKPNTYCEICNIHTTSEQQLTIHMQGTRHFKKFKEICPEKAFAERDSHLSRNILNCRTPSGQFYCKTCDITVVDDKVFSQHLISKRHAKNLKKQQNQSEQTVTIDNSNE